MDSLQMGVHLGVWQKVRVTVVLAIAFSSEHAGTVRLENLEDPCRAAPEDKQQGMSIVCYRSCRHHAAVGHVSGCREEPADQPLPAGDSVHVAGPGDGEGMLSRLQQQTCPSLGAARTLGRLITEVMACAQALCSPFAGIIGNMYNRLHLVATGTVLWGTMALGMGFSHDYTEVQPWGMPAAPPHSRMAMGLECMAGDQAECSPAVLSRDWLCRRRCGSP